MGTCKYCGTPEYDDGICCDGREIEDLQRQLAEAQAERDSLRAVVAQMREWAKYNQRQPGTGGVYWGDLDAILASQPKVLDLHTALSLAGWEIYSIGPFGNKNLAMINRKKEADDEVD